MGKALQIRQKAADSPQGLTARRWPALLALARKAAGPYGEDVAGWPCPKHRPSPASWNWRNA